MLLQQWMKKEICFSRDYVDDILTPVHCQEMQFSPYVSPRAGKYFAV